MSRSIWKVPVFIPFSLNQQQDTASEDLIFRNRASLMSESRVNYRLHIYNGQRWFPVRVTSERVGHRVGEFAPTRKRPIPKKKKQVKKK